MPFTELIYEEAQTILRSLLREIDGRSPGLIRDVYITGSIALGDARPGRSDIDVVLIRPDTHDNATTMSALEPVMDEFRELYPLPVMDGIVLSRRDLVAGPDAIYGDRPIIVDSAIQLSEGGSARNPVTWHTLRQSGIAWRGIPIPELDLWHETDRLKSWTAANLEEYWRPWLMKSDRPLTSLSFESLLPTFTEWGVLGVSRLYATLMTGDIFSKHDAGIWALENIPSEWHRIILEAIRIRGVDGTIPQFYASRSLRRRNDARGYIRMVLDRSRELF